MKSFTTQNVTCCICGEAFSFGNANDRFSTHIRYRKRHRWKQKDITYADGSVFKGEWITENRYHDKRCCAPCMSRAKTHREVRMGKPEEHMKWTMRNCFALDDLKHAMKAVEMKRAVARLKGKDILCL